MQSIQLCGIEVPWSSVLWGQLCVHVFLHLGFQLNFQKTNWSLSSSETVVWCIPHMCYSWFLASITHFCVLFQPLPLLDVWEPPDNDLRWCGLLLWGEWEIDDPKSWFFWQCLSCRCFVEYDPLSPASFQCRSPFDSFSFPVIFKHAPMCLYLWAWCGEVPHLPPKNVSLRWAVWCKHHTPQKVALMQRSKG